jgi:signal transduction histidine kinase
MNTELTDVPGHAATLAILIRKIIVEDIVILSIAAWISYLFAGYTLKPVQRSLLVQKNFSENASHELRTPLSVMKSEAEVLLRNQNPTEEVVRNTLTSIIEEIDRMTKMANDLLLLARSEQPTTLLPKTINIVQVAEAMVQKMQSHASVKGVNLSCVHNKSECIIHGDSMALERVFLNLIQNAITYTPQGGTVTVALKNESKNAIILIKDTGVGISTKDLPHVFERFYTGNNSKGTGLGLPIVKEIIESHYGSIHIRSVMAKGTEITLKLPCIYVRHS